MNTWQEDSTIVGTLAIFLVLVVLLIVLERYVYRKHGWVAALLLPVRLLFAGLIAYGWLFADGWWCGLALTLTPFTLLFSFLGNSWSRTSFFGFWAIVGFFRGLWIFWQWAIGNPSVGVFDVFDREIFGFQPE